LVALSVTPNKLKKNLRGFLERRGQLSKKALKVKTPEKNTYPLPSPSGPDALNLDTIEVPNSYRP
jgi:hypothetical protein